MAKNIIFAGTNRQSVTCTQPATPASGDPVLFGDVPGYAETAERADGRTTVAFGPAVAEIPVKGVNAGGNSAVADGDVLYYVAGDTPPVSKKVAGVRFGVAESKPTDTSGGTLVAAGATGTIRVRAGF
jgi:predicted RecA/RadA family phage recombinase